MTDVFDPKFYNQTPDQMKDFKKSASRLPGLLTRTQELLTPVRESIANKPPYISSSFRLLTPVQGHQRWARG
jgi:hypothetical protein